MNYYKNITKGSGNDRCEKHPARAQAMSRLPGKSFLLEPSRKAAFTVQTGRKENSETQIQIQ
jgi:hypothetical protein